MVGSGYIEDASCCHWASCKLLILIYSWLVKQQLRLAATLSTFALNSWWWVRSCPHMGHRWGHLLPFERWLHWLFTALCYRLFICLSCLSWWSNWFLLEGSFIWCWRWILINQHKVFLLALRWFRIYLEHLLYPLSLHWHLCWLASRTACSLHQILPCSMIGSDGVHTIFASLTRLEATAILWWWLLELHLRWWGYIEGLLGAEVRPTFLYEGWQIHRLGHASCLLLNFRLQQKR